MGLGPMLLLPGMCRLTAQQYGSACLQVIQLLSHHELTGLGLHTSGCWGAAEH